MASVEWKAETRRDGQRAKTAGVEKGQRAYGKKKAVKEGVKTIACYDGSGMDNGK